MLILDETEVSHVKNLRKRHQNVCQRILIGVDQNVGTFIGLENL